MGVSRLPETPAGRAGLMLHRLYFRHLLGASLLVSLGSCSDAVPTSPASPSLPAPQSYVVSGTVFETVDGASRPVAGRKVDVFSSGICEQIIPGRDCAREKAEVVDTDQNGRYSVPVQVPDSRPSSSKPLVYVTGAGLHALGQQPCLASALVDKDTTIDVQVFQVGSSLTPPPVAGPMITGFVYETTPQGRIPWREVSAWLEVGFGDVHLVARTQTDDAGRFFFCRVNAPVRMVVSGHQDMVAAGYRDGVAFIPGTGDMFFEIEVKP
jgi:hypothetical protein